MFIELQQLRTVLEASASQASVQAKVLIYLGLASQVLEVFPGRRHVHCLLLVVPTEQYLQDSWSCSGSGDKGRPSGFKRGHAGRDSIFLSFRIYKAEAGEC